MYCFVIERGQMKQLKKYDRRVETMLMIYLATSQTVVILRSFSWINDNQSEVTRVPIKRDKMNRYFKGFFFRKVVSPDC